MALADLQSPLDEFYGRVREIRAVVSAIESVVAAPTAIATSRAGVDLTKAGPQTVNTANSMALVFLASSFEEFVRDELTQCSGYLSDKYPGLPAKTRHSIRNLYWQASLERLRRRESILNKPSKNPDVAVLASVSVLLDGAQKFVVGDDPAPIDGRVVTQSSNNFKPHVIDSLATRVGISELINRTAEAGKIKAYFGTSMKTQVAEKLRQKLNEFYDRRNETVHSLSGVTGFAVNVIMDYAQILELTAESMKQVLVTELATW